jgi:membrane associated rhomboid family serine protease
MILVPVANTAYIRRRPYVTLSLIALNTALWIYATVAPPPSQPLVAYYEVIQTLYRRHALPFESREIFELRLAKGLILSRESTEYRAWAERRRLAEAAAQGTDAYLIQQAGFIPERGFDWRLVSSLFLHGDFMHLFMNMLFLFLVGCNVEDGWGRLRYLAFYLLAGVVANLAHYASDPRGDLPLVGASGAVSGVMGAFVVFHTFTRIKFFWWFILFGFFELPAIVAIAGWFLLQVLNAFFFKLDSVVAYGAHIGGFLFGLAVALPIRIVRGAPERPKRIVPGKEETQVALPGANLFGSDWAYEDALKRAERSLEEGAPEEALVVFQQVLEREPAHLGARWGLVRCYRALGRRREALRVGEGLIADLTASGHNEDARRVYSYLMS